MRARTCKVCKTKHFNKIIPNICSPQCGFELSKINLQKKKDREFQELKRNNRLNDRSYQEERTQRKCNEYIRLRDKDKGCVSCGTQNPNIQYCAGHFKTRAARPDLRYNEYNIWLQCNKRCNSELSGNIPGYRPELINRIGLSHVEWLETDKTRYKLTIEEIREIYDYYKEKIAEIKTE